MEDLLTKFVNRFGRLPTEYDPDYLEMLAMSRYRIIDVPDQQPGKCGNCGASKDDGRRYVDFGLYVDWYGAVHLCTLCLKDIATAAGIFKELEEKMLALVVENERYVQLKDQGVFLHETVVNVFKEFEEYYARLHSLGDDNSPDSSSSLESDKNSGESGTDSARASRSKSGATKSTNGSGSKDVRSLADLLNDTGN